MILVVYITGYGYGDVVVVGVPGRCGMGSYENGMPSSGTAVGACYEITGHMDIQINNHCNGFFDYACGSCQDTYAYVITSHVPVISPAFFFLISAHSPQRRIC